MTAVIIFHLLDPLLVKFKSEFKFEIPSIIPVIVKPVLLLAGTFAFKVIVGKILNIRDDVSIVNSESTISLLIYVPLFNENYFYVFIVDTKI